MFICNRSIIKYVIVLGTNLLNILKELFPKYLHWAVR